MDQRVFYAAGNSKALSYALQELELRGLTVVEEASPAVTHLLLPAPCKEDVREVLQTLPDTVHIIGGALDRPELEHHTRTDLLKDPLYLAQNAQITAHCAVSLAVQQLPVILEGCPVLIIGWGRIGKCLGNLLKNMGADVSIAARKSADRAMVAALGYTAEDTAQLRYILCRYRLIYNTAPEPVLSAAQTRYCRPECLKVDLASRPGIEGDGVIQALGLPGKMAPESSGKLIARSIMRLCAQKEGSL